MGSSKALCIQLYNCIAWFIMTKYNKRTEKINFQWTENPSKSILLSGRRNFVSVKADFLFAEISPYSRVSPKIKSVFIWEKPSPVNRDLGNDEQGSRLTGPTFSHINVILLSGISIKTIFTRAHLFWEPIFFIFVYIFLVADWSIFYQSIRTP